MRLEWRAAGSAGPPLGLVFGAVLILGAAAAAVWLRLGLPTPVCRLRQLTGVPCPTCGSTRLVESLLRGDVVGALLANPLVFAGGALLASWFVASAVTRLARTRVAHLRLEPREWLWVRIAAVVAVIASWLYIVLRDV